MKQKSIIAFTLFLIAVVIVFMVYDFYSTDNEVKNVYKYNIDKHKKFDSTLVQYSEISNIKPDINKIKSITIDNTDNIYITGEDKIHIFNKNRKFIRSFVTENESVGIATDNDRKVYIGKRDHVEVRDSLGNIVKKWETINDKVYITNIAISDSSVFVADAGNRIVYRYNLDGEFQNEIGRKDTIKGIPGFFIPSPNFDLLIGRDKELWVVNPGKHSFEAYTESGSLISSWKRTSVGVEGFSGCCNPSNIAILSDGSFVTSEKGIERVKVHKPSGDFKCMVAGSDKFEDGTKGIDLAVDSEDKIYVLDPQKNIIRIFKKKN